MKRLAFALLVLAAGCASSGQPGVEPVEVYFLPSEVPCEYEFVGEVRGEVQAEGNFEWRRRTTQVLGREGARLGFDAVLIDTSRETARVTRVDRSQVSVPRVPVVGNGLRYLDPSCTSLG